MRWIAKILTARNRKAIMNRDISWTGKLLKVESISIEKGISRSDVCLRNDINFLYNFGIWDGLLECHALLLGRDGCDESSAIFGQGRSFRQGTIKHRLEIYLDEQEMPHLPEHMLSSTS